MIRIAVVGAAGRMGTMLCSAFANADDTTVTAKVDPSDPTCLASLEDVAADDVDVVVDFSTAEVARASVAWAAAHDRGVVVGTTGFSADELDQWETTYANAHVVVAANFALGAVLAQRFAAEAAPYFDRVEIIEYHHDRKVDAPSGTALETARAIREARRAAGLGAVSEPTTSETVEGSRGADSGDNVRVHAVRMPGMTAHQDIIFGGPGEGLTLRHDAYDRTSFAAGVLLAVRHVRERPGVTRGLAPLL